MLYYIYHMTYIRFAICVTLNASFPNVSRKSVNYYTVSNRNAGSMVETPELRSYNAEFRSFSMDSPPFLVF